MIKILHQISLVRLLNSLLADDSTVINQLTFIQPLILEVNNRMLMEELLARMLETIRDIR